VIDSLATRDLEEYQPPYVGKYRRPNVIARDLVTVYVPEVGDEVFVNMVVDPDNSYNPLGIPEPGTVTCVDHRQKLVEVSRFRICFPNKCSFKLILTFKSRSTGC
jgi:hypothetical protein